MNPLVAFDSQEAFDRAMRAVRAAEATARASGQLGTPGRGTLAANQVVRIASTMLNEYDETGQDVNVSPGPFQTFIQPYLGRISTKYPSNTPVENRWMDGPRCLVFSLNGEELFYGCRYEGRIFGEINGFPIVGVNAGRHDCRCLEPLQGAAICDGEEAAPEFMFVIPPLAEVARAEFGELAGDWSVLHTSGGVWMCTLGGPWELTISGSTWTLVGTGVTGKTVSFSATPGAGFCTGGGTLAFQSSTATWDTAVNEVELVATGGAVDGETCRQKLGWCGSTHGWLLEFGDEFTAFQQIEVDGDPSSASYVFDGADGFLWNYTACGVLPSSGVIVVHAGITADITELSSTGVLGTPKIAATVLLTLADENGDDLLGFDFYPVAYLVRDEDGQEYFGGFPGELGGGVTGVTFGHGHLMKRFSGTPGTPYYFALKVYLVTGTLAAGAGFVPSTGISATARVRLENNSGSNFIAVQEVLDSELCTACEGSGSEDGCCDIADDDLLVTVTDGTRDGEWTAIPVHSGGWEIVFGEATKNWTLECAGGTYILTDFAGNFVAAIIGEDGNECDPLALSFEIRTGFGGASLVTVELP